MIYSLNQKIDRVLFNADAFKQEAKTDSEFVKTSKMTILNQINSVIIDICMAQLTEKLEDFRQGFSQRLDKVEDQLKDLQFSLICRGRYARSNSIDDQICKISNQKIYEQLENGVLEKVQTLNGELEGRFNEKIYEAINKEIETLKKEIQTHTSENNNNLKANINTNNRKHERKPSASNIFSDIFSWKKSNSVNFSSLIHDENNANPHKFQEVFGTEVQEISKVNKFIVDINYIKF